MSIDEQPTRETFMRGKRRSVFDHVAGAVTRAVGTSAAFGIAFVAILLWGVSGPLFAFSETWQLVINTATTIVTFLMVFVIQHAQNKDSVALHLKLNELLSAHRHASNRLIAIEDLDEEELATLRRFYCRLGELAAEDRGVERTHSLDEALQAHEEKSTGRDRSL